MKNCMNEYAGFEIGPIRPPSESESLMVRVTRNCPWNKCKFCGLYKGKKFSIRKKEHVFRDIDIIEECINKYKAVDRATESERSRVLKDLKESLGEENQWALHSSASWYRAGMKSIFLQDANSMVIKPDDMVEILEYIRDKFPEVDRITSYARSHTIARMSDDDIKRIAEAGVNRIHIGMETASDKILKLINKGVDKETHVNAGKKVKRAGIELSEYFMPGLGGNEFSYENAIETADALNQINPDFIRIRTLAVTEKSELMEDYKAGIFTRTNDTKMVEELLTLLENLKGITSTVKSDHILNLVTEVKGTLPQDREKMIDALKTYLNFDEDQKMLFRIGRRTGRIIKLKDMNNPKIVQEVKGIIKAYGIDKKNLDKMVDELMNRFI